MEGSTSSACYFSSLSMWAELPLGQQWSAESCLCRFHLFRPQHLSNTWARTQFRCVLGDSWPHNIFVLRKSLISVRCNCNLPALLFQVLRESPAETMNICQNLEQIKCSTVYLQGKEDGIYSELEKCSGDLNPGNELCGNLSVHTCCRSQLIPSLLYVK